MTLQKRHQTSTLTITVLSCLKICLVLFMILADNLQAADTNRYFISKKGNDSWDGKHPIHNGGQNGPWQTLKNVSGLAAGSDVYLRCGDIWKNQNLTINWSGKDTDPVIIGAYYGSGVIGVKHKRPHIQGTMSRTIQNGNHGKPKFKIVDPGFPGDWNPLLKIDANRVEIDGLEVSHSSGTGISIRGHAWIVVRNCNIYETFRQALQIRDTTQILVENCDLHHGAKVYPLAHGDLGQPPTVTVKYCEQPTFRNNRIHDSYFEGINLDVGTYGAILENNEIFGNPRLQVYLCNSTKNIVRGNLIYGTQRDDLTFGPRNGKGHGLWINNERQWDMPVLPADNLIYNNLIANTKTNIWIAGNHDRLVNNVRIYNNTLVEAHDPDVGGESCGFRIQAGTGYGHIFENNIIIQKKGRLFHGPAEKVTADYNLWSGDPGAVRGKNSIIDKTFQLARDSGWQNGRYVPAPKTMIPKAEDFKIQRLSKAIDAGKPQLFFDTDYFNKKRNQEGTGWDIGAHEYSE